MEIGKLTDETDIGALSDNFECRSCVQMELIPECFRDRQPTPMVDFCLPVLLFLGRAISPTHLITIFESE